MIPTPTSWLSSILAFSLASIRRFPEMGVPPVIIHFYGIFHYKPTILDTPSHMETPILTFYLADGRVRGQPDREIAPLELALAVGQLGN